MVTCHEPQVISTSRYSIRETCDILCITRKTLDKYTKQGLIHCDYRPKTLRKFYTGHSIMKFWRAAV